MLHFSPHIAVAVRDYPNALDFYTKVMGMTMSKHQEHESELQVGDLTLHIENNAAEQQTWLEFRVDDVELLKVRLEAAGCTLQKTHLQKSYLVVDPYGMRFHIWEDPEASSQGASAAPAGD